MVLVEETELEVIKKALFTRNFMEQTIRDTDDENLRGMFSNILKAVDEEYERFLDVFREEWNKKNVEISKESSEKGNSIECDSVQEKEGEGVS